MDKLEYYIKAFSSLHTDKGKNKYPSQTRYQAPHKPILLLSLIDLMAEEMIKENFTELTPELRETFTSYWSIVMSLNKKGKIVYPFFHLKKDVILAFNSK